MLNDFGDGVKIGVISSPPEEKPKSFKATIKIINGNEYKKVAKPANEILVYFEKDTSHTPPEFGDLIGFISDVRYIESNGNPLEFDYQQYMSRQGIYCQAYIKNNEYEILQPAYQKGINRALMVNNSLYLKHLHLATKPTLNPKPSPHSKQAARCTYSPFRVCTLAL